MRDQSFRTNSNEIVSNIKAIFIIAISREKSVLYVSMSIVHPLLILYKTQLHLLVYAGGIVNATALYWL